VAGEGFSVVFDEKTGGIRGYYHQGDTLLLTGPQPDFWRAPTDNDQGGWKADAAFGWRFWEQARLWQADSLRHAPEGQNYRVEAWGRLPGSDTQVGLSYLICPDGRVTVELTYLPGAAPLPAFMPRFGTGLTLPGDLTQVSWYGRGPGPSYVDRKEAAVGIYQLPVTAMHHPYPRPQENGNRIDTRWLSFSGAEGSGLKIVADSLLSFGVSHFSKTDLAQADYDFQLIPRPEIYLQLDLRQMGVGGYNSWSPKGLPTPDHRVTAGEAMHFRYHLVPIKATKPR